MGYFRYLGQITAPGPHACDRIFVHMDKEPALVKELRQFQNQFGIRMTVHLLSRKIRSSCKTYLFWWERDLAAPQVFTLTERYAPCHFVEIERKYLSDKLSSER